MNDMKRSGRASSVRQELAAGCFSSWLRRTRAGMIREASIRVDCGSCRACCTSSYFIHIRPEETRTKARINRRLLFPAPGMPKGNVLMGYDERGHCPMQTRGGCAIYEDRPQTCRIYDCRIFAAAGIDAGGEDKKEINARVHQWRFSYPTPKDRALHQAVQAAARFLLEKADCFPAGAVPGNPSQLAILAIKVYRVFMGTDADSERRTDAEIAKAVVEENERFEARRLAECPK